MRANSWLAARFVRVYSLQIYGVPTDLVIGSALETQYEYEKDGKPFLVRTNVNKDVRVTDRQREVLELLAESKVMKEIGVILQLSQRTVTYHKYGLMKRLRVRAPLNWSDTPLEPGH